MARAGRSFPLRPVILHGPAPPAATTYNDAPAGSLTITGTRTESRVFEDTRSGTLALSGTRSESKAYADSTSGSAVVSGVSTDALLHGYTDAPTGGIAASGAVTSTRSYTDPASGQTTTTGSVGDELTHDATPSGTLAASGSAADQYARGYQDAPSGALAATGTLTEDIALDDAATGTADVSGTVSESYSAGVFVSYADAPTGQLDVSGTADDAQEYDDEPTGTLGGRTVIVTPPPAPAPGIVMGSQVPVIIRVHDSAPVGALDITGSLAETYTAPAPPVPAEQPRRVEYVYVTPDPVIETRIERVEVAVPAPYAVAYVTRESRPVGVLTFSGIANDEWFAAPRPVPADAEIDPEVLFELLTL